MNLKQFNVYFSENYDSLSELSLRIVKDKEKSVDILHKAYESISKILNKKDLEDIHIRGYVSRTIKNWSRQTGSSSDKFNKKMIVNYDISTNERLHKQEQYIGGPDIYAFKRRIDEYLLCNYPLPDASLFKLKFVYGYTYDRIVSYTKINRAVAHEIITKIHADLKEKFKDQYE